MEKIETLQITSLGEFILEYCSRIDQLPKNVSYKRIMENTDKIEKLQPKLESMKELLNNEDIQRMWMKMHTPWIHNKKKVGRNEICPFCNSGKKYKDCECYKNKDVAKFRLDIKHTKGWN